MSPASNHTTVLLEEAVAALAIRPDGLYIDGTFGRGGHSRLILKQLSEKGQLLAIDKDPQAIEYAQANFASDANFQIHSASFSDLPELLTAAGQLGQVDGLLLDLGVSSPQLDQAERGFSFMRDGPLDMRMDYRNGPSAAQWLATAEMTEIAQILKDYGEERFAKRIARAIVEYREERAITTTAQLAQIIKDAHPAWDKHKHPATRSFQAIRIFINRELADLELLLDSVLDILKSVAASWLLASTRSKTEW